MRLTLYNSIHILQLTDRLMFLALKWIMIMGLAIHSNPSHSWIWIHGTMGLHPSANATLQKKNAKINKKNTLKIHMVLNYIYLEF